jgi:transcription initiation factor TFIIIB Brf1 subunit/transcription initiation factor TFIIB
MNSNCVNCNSVLYSDNIKEGFIVCFDCGMTNGNEISNKSEWRLFNSDGVKGLNNIRCEFSNKPLGSELETSQSSWKFEKTSIERHLYTIKEEFSTFSISTQVKSVAFELYTTLYKKMVHEKTIKRCTLRKGLEAACIYYSFRTLNIPMEKKEVAKICNTTMKIVTKGCNYFLDVMGDSFIKMESYKASDFVEKFCNKLQIHRDIQCVIKEMVTVSENDTQFIDNTPTSIVVFCIMYLVLEHNLDLFPHVIFKTCGVSKNIVEKNIHKLQLHKLTFDTFIKNKI